MTDDEYYSEFSIWALAGGQLVFATDPRNMSALQKDILLNTELLAVFNDAIGKPGAMVSNLLDLLFGVSVWAKPLHNSCVAVGVLNGGTAVANGTVAFDTLPVAAGETLCATLWSCGSRALLVRVLVLAFWGVRVFPQL